MNRIYACIDLKSFYASCEAVEAGLDPFKVNLVVADESRGKGAITLAITPALKKLGVKNRCRLFQIPQNIDYIIKKPRMKLYMRYSAIIYGVYLRFVSEEDIHIYSIDECFLDLTAYLDFYKKSPLDLTKMIIDEVYRETGICATGGIGTNIFLAKVALDIEAKTSPNYIGYLDEKLFIDKMSLYEPITDIWGIGKGTASRLRKYGVINLRGIRELDTYFIKKEFGINGQYLVDHAYGRESCTIKDIKKYKPQNRSISNSQILFEDYSYENVITVLKEMVEVIVLELVSIGRVACSISLGIGYSKDAIAHTGGTRRLKYNTCSYNELKEEFIKIYEETTNRIVPIRKVSIAIGIYNYTDFNQLDLFGKAESNLKEKKAMEAIINIKNRYGKNSVFRCLSLCREATGIMRNTLVGGHNGQ